MLDTINRNRPEKKKSVPPLLRFIFKMATLAPWSISFMPSMPHEFSFSPQNMSNHRIPWVALLSR